MYMDRICSAILNKIYALGTAGRYFVISSDEFLEAFPEDGKRDETELKRALKILSADGYIDIKYSSGNMYCVALLKTYTEEEPPLPEHNGSEDGLDDNYEYPQMQKTAYMSAFWAAFVGGALGSGIIGAIALIIRLC